VRKQRSIYHIWSVLVLLVFLVGCSSGVTGNAPADTAPRINPPVELPAALEDWPALDRRHPEVPEEYDLVAESEHLRLYLKRATSALIVEDKRNGRLWRSSPANLDEAQVSQTWRQRIEAPIVLSYTDADRGQAKVSDPRDMEVELTPVEGGVRAHYRFPEDGFELSVAYAVHDDFLEVTVPEAGIVESGEQQNTLVSLDVLAFLGATQDGEEGYIVFPDGSGALMHYTSPRPEAVQEISVPIYGDEQISLRQSGSFHETAPLPVFGLVSGEAAFAAIVTQGDFDARIAVGRSGKTIPYNHAWASFVYRRQGQFSLTGGQPTWLYEPNLAGGDRQIRYCFLTGESANYVGIATRYRDFLVHERGVRRLDDDVPLMSLDFFMGVERRTWFLRDLVKMTKFADVQEMLDDLASAGVSRLDVTVDGWNEGGSMARYPQRLPVEARLGGADGLRALADAVHARGQRLFLTDNYLVVLPEGRGALPYSDAMRGVDGLPLRQGEFFLLNPQVALLKFALRDIPRMADLGANGLRLNYFAGLTVPDTNDRYPLSRESFAASWMQIAALAREQFGAVAMSGGNSYAIPHADRLDWVPLDSTHYDLFDETIPFYQIVAHGLVLYDGQPFNLMNDGQRTFLRQVEYGAIPHFVLTHENSALLTRTFANEHWSTQYSFWRDEVVRQYRAVETLAPLANQFIVAHARLAEGVYETVYEDGTRVVVSYNTSPTALESATVPALDFVVVQGES